MNSVDTSRQETLARRLKGIPGGNRIIWNSKQAAELRDWIMDAPADALRTEAASQKFVDSAELLSSVRTKLLASSMLLKASDGQPGNQPQVFIITTPDVDLQGDIIEQNGVQCDPRNLPVLPGHDSSGLPVGRSSAPWRVDRATLAISNFPPKGTSQQADEYAAMVEAGQLRGASIGFIPIKYKLATDPSRPFGVTFTEIRMIEWSLTPTPCNQSCWLIGPASSKSAQPLGDASARNQRMAEARRLIRSAGLRAKA
jgi:hypothetical protein